MCCVSNPTTMSVHWFLWTFQDAPIASPGWRHSPCGVDMTNATECGDMDHVFLGSRICRSSLRDVNSLPTSCTARWSLWPSSASRHGSDTRKYVLQKLTTTSTPSCHSRRKHHSRPLLGHPAWTSTRSQCLIILQCHINIYIHYVCVYIYNYICVCGCVDIYWWSPILLCRMQRQKHFTKTLDILLHEVFMLWILIAYFMQRKYF